MGILDKIMEFADEHPYMTAFLLIVSMLMEILGI